MADHFNAALMKNRFYEQLEHYRRTNPPKDAMSISDRRYQETLEDIPKAKASENKTAHEIWLLKTFDILNVKGVNKLIHPKSKPALIYLPDGELFDAIHEIHVGRGHIKRERMGTVLRKLYKNVTRIAIDIYLNLCDQCQQKTLKPLSRAQITLIDFKIIPDGEYNFLLFYQDTLTKFIILKSLKTNEPSEVAYNLLDIFSTFGAPAILCYYNDIDYMKQIFECLRKWPTFKIVYGDYKYDKDFHMEKIIEDIKIKILEWMQQNGAQWSIGASFVQLMKNKTYNYDILQPSYKALFGKDIKLGLDMPNSGSLVTEEDLEKFLGFKKRDEEGVENNHALSTVETIAPTPVFESNEIISESAESNINDLPSESLFFHDITNSDEYSMINNIPSSELFTIYYDENVEMANNNISIESFPDMNLTPELITIDASELSTTEFTEPIFETIVIPDIDINTYNNSALIDSFTISDQPTETNVIPFSNF